MGLGLSVLIYESLSASFLYFFLYRKAMDQRCTNDSIPVLTDFGKFFWPSVRAALTEYPAFLFYNFLNVVIGWTGSKEQLAAYSLGYTLMLVMVYLMNGFNMFTRT